MTWPRQRPWGEAGSTCRPGSSRPEPDSSPRRRSTVRGIVRDERLLRAAPRPVHPVPPCPHARDDRHRRSRHGGSARDGRHGPGRQRHHLGPPRAAARAAATGPSTPATATTAACSSRQHLGGLRRRAVRVAADRAPGAADRDRREGARRQGWGAWPACSSKLGLTRADARDRADVSRSTSRSAIKKAKKTTRTSKAAVQRTTSRSVKKSATSRAAYGHYVVRPGDTLSAIANRKGVRGGWHSLYQANRRGIGNNPNLIYVGQRLRLPR